MGHDAYSKIPKLYGMEKITTEEVMDKLDMFQSRFGKIEKFGWWDLERISEDERTQFTSTELKDECQTRVVCLTFAAPEHQEMNRPVEVPWITLRTMSHSRMVHARVPEVYIHFTLMYTTDKHISGSTNQRSYKQECRFKNATQTGNMYKTFSVSFTHVILSMCCT